MPLRLIQLSDIHFGAEDTAAVRAAAAYVNSTPFDLLLVTGDVTQLGHHAEFTSAKDWLASLPGPKLATPGNHDTPWFGLFERVIAPFKRYQCAIGPTESQFTNSGLAVWALNSARGWQVRLNWSKGEVNRLQTRRAIRHMRSAAPDMMRILICHHPLIEIPDEPITSRVRGGRRAARKFAEAAFDLVVTGHLHKPFVHALPFGDGLSYAVGAGTLSRRERGAPPGFNVIEIDGERLSVTAMAWSDGRLEADQVWSVPLRPRPTLRPYRDANA
jgi:3',5'-cyclic AMP phosphodiesterase CpdA